MKLAYAIFVHHKAEQFRRLFRAIWRPEHCYVIHVDRRAAADCHEAARELAAAPNVALLRPSTFTWGGWSMVRIEMRAIRTLVAVPGWSYYINLSGQDFPLRTQEEIARELAAGPEQDWLEWERVMDPPRASMIAQRETMFALELPWRRKAVQIPFPLFWRAALLKDVVRHLGSQWKILTRDTCEWLSVPANTRRFRAAYWATLIPDESFFQTTLLHSPLRARVTGRNRHFIDWDMGPEWPRILRMEDLPRMEASDAFFARKFDDAVDGEVIAALERRLGIESDGRAPQRSIA